MYSSICQTGVKNQIYVVGMMLAKRNMCHMHKKGGVNN